jgi:hypothetical protein
VKSVLLKSILKISLSAALVAWASQQLYASGFTCPNITGYDECMNSYYSSCTPTMGRCSEYCQSNQYANYYYEIIECDYQNGIEGTDCQIEDIEFESYSNSCMQQCVNNLISCESGCASSYCAQ